ncbi:hypothetical protein C8J57DRAFT_1302447 [Mycena rebaudengoi]|nr:hypothetical protein C8J57DRAFT_1302447 [Mycena rebaudengoi]
MPDPEKVPPDGPIPVVVDTPGDEPCAKIWSVYISEAEKYDKALVDSWRGNMNGMLIFAGLFSAILTAFIIESYKTLRPDSNETVVDLLNQISRQLAGNNSKPLLEFSGTAPFTPPTTSLVCNTLWFISLGLSLASALTATLVEQWAREFLQRTEMLPSPVKRARIFSYLYYGLQRYRMHTVVALIPLLLHLSLLFFFAGLVSFLRPVNKTVMIVAATLLAVVVVLYGCMTILPLLWFDCPYKTPLSVVLWNVRRISALFVLRRFPASHIIGRETTTTSPHLRSMVGAMVETATVRSDTREVRDKRALAWTMKSLADDDELEPFVEGIPNAIWGPQGRRRKYDDLIRGLLSDPLVLLGSRIEHLLLGCESGLLEPSVKIRRQTSCLKAIWCLGMMAEKNFKSIQPLFFLRKSFRFLPPKTPTTAQYLPSIAALVQWSNFCSLQGHVEELALYLRDAEAASLQDKFPDMQPCYTGLEEFLVQRRRCDWHYLIPITLGEMDLQKLSNRTPQNSRDLTVWVREVSQLINLIPACWNALQHRILLSFLQESADLELPPYEFELTYQTIETSLDPVDIPLEHVASTFSYNVEKAVQMKTQSITHVDMILGILLPLFDAVNDEVDVDSINYVTDSLLEYVNNRNCNEAVCRVFQDCNLTRVWCRITNRLSTCRPDRSGEVSKAMWLLVSLFPGRSATDARLATWPDFDRNSLAVAPVAPYKASVEALLRTQILNAYEAAEVRLHLQALDAILVTAEKPSISNALMSQFRLVKNDWPTLASICSLLNKVTPNGPHLRILPPLPVHTIQTHETYTTWRKQTMTAVQDALQLIPDLDKRIGEARLAILVQFLQACSSDESALPYNPLETLGNILPSLWAPLPVHPILQKDFAVALGSLLEVHQSRLLQALIASNVFSEELPWLDDPKSLKTMKGVLQTYATVTFDGSGLTAQGRKLEDILTSLELKENALAQDFRRSSINGPVYPGNAAAGPSKARVNG